MNGFTFSQRSLDRMNGVHDDLVKVAHYALAISRVDFGIPEHGGLRTEREQLELFRDGLSKADGVKNKSRHQTGKALDVYAYVNGRASWEPEHLAMVAAAMLQAASKIGVSLEWGGLWSSFQDMPHFQLSE